MEQTEQFLKRSKKDLLTRLGIAIVVAVVALILFKLDFYRQHLEVVLVIVGVLIVFYIDMFLIKKNMLKEILESHAEEKNLILDVKEKVMNLDQAKAEFVSLAIHQLRAPLTGVRWALKMVLDGEMGEISTDLKNILIKTYESSTKALTVLNELINIDRVEPSRLKYNFETVDVVSVVENAIEFSTPQAQDNKISIVFNKPEDSSSLPVSIDKEKILTAIVNLLENAIKYTIGAGIVNVLVKESSGNAEIIVKDNGIGIPLKDQANVFTKFFRAHNALEMRMQGSGVGLFMIKNVVEKHGGKIWFESEENQGTAFHISLPLA